MFDDELINETLHTKSYTNLGTIGRGGFAQIYKVRSEQYGVDFAAKVVTKQTSFGDEINILMTLVHPNILSIYNIFEDEKYQYLIMENCSGGSLNDFLNKYGIMKDVTAIGILYEVVDALILCHQHQIAHLDIKPCNILIDSNNRIKICDFGLSKVVQEGEKLECVSGSLPFMAPEMIGKEPYNPYLADIWSLGITFYMLLSGKSPWKGFTKRDIREAIMKAEIDFKPIENSKLLQIIKGMCQKNPKDRIHLQEIIRQLEPMMHERIHKTKTGPPLPLLPKLVKLPDSKLRMPMETLLTKRMSSRMSHSKTQPKYSISRKARNCL